jgi:hypothetical protein
MKNLVQDLNKKVDVIRLGGGQRARERHLSRKEHQFNARSSCRETESTLSLIPAALSWSYRNSQATTSTKTMCHVTPL